MEAAPGAVENSDGVAGTAVSNSTSQKSPEWMIKKVRGVLKSIIGNDLAPETRLDVLSAIIHVITEELQKFPGKLDPQVLVKLVKVVVETNSDASEEEQHAVKKRGVRKALPSKARKRKCKENSSFGGKGEDVGDSSLGGTSVLVEPRSLEAQTPSAGVEKA